MSLCGTCRCDLIQICALICCWINLLELRLEQDSVVIRSRVGKHRLQVALRQRQFMPSKHRIIRGDKRKPPSFTLIDGKRAWGAADTIPLTELSLFSLKVDGREWKIARPQWNDCFEPNLTKDSVRTTLSRDGRRVTVIILGGDGYGGYKAIWAVRREGTVRRSIQPYDGDN
jgi:hypothetical protein